MGKHSAQPTKTDITHVAVRKVRTRTHQYLVFCKHFIVESSAGLFGILIFEAYRSDWLKLVGHGESGQNHAIHMITYITDISSNFIV